MASVHQRLSETSILPHTVPGKTNWHKQVVNIALWVIVIFQLINLPGATLNKSIPALLVIIPGLALCGLAFLFHHLGKTPVVSVLLIVMVNLGCGLMLLTTPGGLDVGNLPVFDMLVVSELLAVSLLPAERVFLVVLNSILLTFLDITFQPHTAALDHFLASGIGYTAIVHPVSLQIIVAVVTYIWVRSTQYATARADHAEEIAELRKAEADRKHKLDASIEQMSQVLACAANGDHSIRIDLHQENVLWRIGNLFNLLMTRLARANRLELENQQLRMQVTRLTEETKAARISSQQAWRQASK